MRTFFIGLTYLSPTDLSEAKKTVAQILHENRTFVLIMLGVPVFGMAVAFGIILWKQPDNMIKVLAVIFFLAVQYILMMFFWSKRVEVLAKKDEEKKLEDSEEHETGESQDAIPEVNEFKQGNNVLKPDEERIFSSENKE